jgi:thioredoxin-like negative regulator of GroEL
MAPHLAVAALKLAGRARILKLNVDQTVSPGRLGIIAVPSLLLFVNGREVARETGLPKSDAIVNWVEACALFDPVPAGPQRGSHTA